MLTSLRALLRTAARSLGVERAAHAALIAEMWPEIVGAEAAAHSRPAGLRADVLLAEAEVGPWAQELSAQRTRWIAAINQRLGAPVVTEIRFRQVAGWVARGQAARDDGGGAQDVELTAEEREDVERAVSEIRDAEVRDAARRAMVSQMQWRKRHVRASGR